MKVTLQRLEGHGVTTLRSLALNADGRADNALLDRSVTMRAASCDQYTWVRVEGPGQVSDLLIPANPRRP